MRGKIVLNVFSSTLTDHDLFDMRNVSIDDDDPFNILLFIFVESNRLSSLFFFLKILLSDLQLKIQNDRVIYCEMRSKIWYYI